MQSVNVMTFFLRTGIELTIHNPVAADSAHNGVTIRDEDGFEYFIRLSEVVATRIGGGVLPEMRSALLSQTANGHEAAVRV